MGFGNQLYLWAWAHAHRLEAPPHRVLIVQRSRYWLPYFPAVRSFLLEASEMSFWDRRGHFYAYKEEHSGDPRGVTNESRAAFVREWILTSPALEGAGLGPMANDDVLTLNLRGGTSTTTLGTDRSMHSTSSSTSGTPLQAPSSRTAPYAGSTWSLTT